MMIEEVKNQVFLLLDKDKSGHGMDHINRVLDLSLKFALKENANLEIVSLIALLHDVDDYKLFGETDFYNAKEIVLKAINMIGYSKRLSGIIPDSIETKVVSDAYMCDARGASDIIRTYAYSKNYNRPFFDKEIQPL